MRFDSFFPFTHYSTIPTFQYSNWGEAPKGLTAIPNHTARLNIKRHFTNIHIRLVSKTGSKVQKTIHVGKVRCQAN
jgi:hypothetical protein